METKNQESQDSQEIQQIQETQEVQPDKDSFESLGLSSILMDALNKKNFKKATPIQAATIPIILKSDRDMIAQAQTGTGKTAAFGLPMLDKLNPGASDVQAIIVTPTRELTMQVSRELSELKGAKKLSIVPIYGGQSIDLQKQQLRRGRDIIVGTPGRVLDHLKQKTFTLSQVKMLVLDEADEMLNGGFIEDIELLLSKTGDEKQILLFSATMPQSVLRLAQTYMVDPQTIQVARSATNESLTEQFFLECGMYNRFGALCRVIDVQDEFYGLIFCRTKREVDQLCEQLVQVGYPAESMHGDLSQHQRESVLKKFRNKTSKILVVSDVAARGLDINDLTHVVNYSLPQDAESYVHRVGRTGRAGKTGMAISIISPAEFRRIRWIENVTKKSIKKMVAPTLDEIEAKRKGRINDLIEKTMANKKDSGYEAFAIELLEKHEAKDVLVGLLGLITPTNTTKYKMSEERSYNGGGGRPNNNGQFQRRRFKDSGAGPSQGRRPFRQSGGYGGGGRSESGNGGGGYGGGGRSGNGNSYGGGRGGNGNSYGGNGNGNSYGGGNNNGNGNGGYRKKSYAGSGGSSYSSNSENR